MEVSYDAKQSGKGRFKICYISNYLMAKEHDDSFSKARMEALTDGIFATVMTILVLSLVVPIITSPTLSTAQLSSTILSLLPNIMVYVLSFIVILVMWIGHNNVIRYMHKVNPKILWLNGFFMLLVGMIPISTAFLGRYPLAQPTIILYAVNFLLISVMFRVLINMVGKNVMTNHLAMSSRSNWLMLTIYIVAIAISFVSTYISLGLFALMPIYYIYQAFFGVYRDLD